MSQQTGNGGFLNTAGFRLCSGLRLAVRLQSDYSRS